MTFDFLQPVIGWFEQHQWVAGSLIGFSVLALLATLVCVPWLIVRLPPDYFAHNRPPRLPWGKAHPALRLAIVIGKNLLGVFLILLGILLSLPLVPGPGIVTILIGLALVDIPGRKALQRRIATQPKVFNALNNLRAKYGKPPLEKPEQVGSSN